MSNTATTQGGNIYAGGALQNNGGATLTHARGLDSPARDGGTNSGCPATDQRGASCDIGAYEGTPVRRVYLPLIKR